MKLFSLKRRTIPKLAVLATGLTAAILVATINPVPAQAYPTYGTGCSGCHTPGGSVSATPSSATVAPGASYTVALAYTGGTVGGKVGYAITGNGANVTASTAGPVSMTAPAAAGDYTYTVWMRTGVVASTLYTITVAAAPVAVTTTTALAVTPASPVVAPGAPTLTATVTGAGAAGTVQFLNGSTVLGTSTVAAGRATLALTAVAAGSYNYTASFIPTSAAAFTPSTSTAVAYVVTAPVPVAVTTTTALAVTPASPVVAPASPTLTATVTGAGAAGTVEFFNGTTSLGTGQVAAGVATKVLSGIAVGTYSYTAKFIPTSAAAFTPSTSTAVAYVVTAPVPVAVTTTTALAVTPASPVVAPASPTLTATVTGAGAAGTVEFFNGTTSLGTGPVAAGVATKVLNGIIAGSYSYHAVFTPTDAALFTSSTSGNLVFTVTVPSPVQVTTTTVLAMNPTAITDVAPAAKTLNATVTGANAAGLVEFFNGTTSLGTNPVDAAGIASKALTAIPAGSYSYRAVFTPTNAALFTSSTSTDLVFTVTVPSPVQVTTTTVLAMTPTATTAVAPAAKTLTATVGGLNAAGNVQFFDGSTSLGTSPVAAGTANKVLTAIPAGSYSYHAVFTPTDAALFTSSTSVGNLAFTVTATPVGTAPVASFTVVTTLLTAALTDTSTNAPTSWSWNLGNGTTTTAKSPSVTYAAAGTYTVVLTAANSAGSSTATKTITVTAPTGTSAAHISRISTDEASVGTKVTITGTGFRTAGVVKFGTVTATVLSYTNTTIVVSVPAVSSEEVRVTVTPTGGTASNGVEFEVKGSDDGHSGWDWGHFTGRA